MSKPKSLLKVRITNADHAMEPSGTMDNTSLPKVPIIRIYGLSSMGHKTCVHVHLTWPYMYVEYKGSMTPDAVNKFSSRLLKSLNHAVAISLRKNPADVRSKYIRAIHVVKGVHLYGFHCTWTPFLKIYIIDPQHTIRIATILRSGGIMQQKFQVFESHLSYLLQFMCDFGLYGCGELEISEASVRQRPVDPHAGDDDEGEVDTSMFSVSSYPRISTMALELDVLAYHILNPLLLAPRNIHNSLHIPGLPLPSEPLVLSVRELWEDERKRRIAKGLPATPSMPASVGADRSDGPSWRAEPRLRSELNARIEKAEEDGAEYYPDPSVRAWEDHVMTAFESRGSLWPPEHRVYKPTTPSEESPFNSPEGFDPTSHAISRTTSKVDDGFEIDEVFLTSQGMDNLLRTTTKNDEGIDDDDFQDDDDVFDEQDDPSRGDGSPKKRRSGHSPTKSLQNSPTKGSLQHNRSIHQTPSKQATGDRSSPFRRNLTPSKSFTSGQARANPFREQPRPVNEESLISPTKVPRRSASAFQRSEDQSEIGKSTPSHATASNSSRMTSGRYSAISSGLEQYYSAETSDAASVHIGDSGSSQEHTSTTGDGIVGSMRELGPKDGKDPRASPSPVLGQQRLSGAISSGTGPSSGEPALEKKNVANVGLGMKGVTWPDSLGSFQSPTFSSQRGTLSSPQAADTRLRSETSFTYPLLPPTSTDVLFDITERGLKDVLYRDPYYSNLKDVPKRSREYAGRLFSLKGGTGVGSLPPWDDGEPQYDTQYPDSPSKRSVAGEKWGSSRKPLRSKGVSGWEYAGGVRPGPPSRREIERWLEETDGGLQPVDNLSRRKAVMQSQIIGPTQRNRYGFQVTQSKQPDGGGRERQNMSVLSIEVFSVSRGSLLPNPEFDRVECILFAFQEQDVVITDQAQRRASYICGCMAVESEALQPNRMRDPRIELYENELDLFNTLIDRVKEWDPDVLTGWELQNGSWGYVSERARREYSFDLSDMIGRVISFSSRGAGNVKYDTEHTSTFHVSGRHVLNTWRIMRAEQSLTSYSMENVVFHVLHRRAPHYSAETLSQWFKSKSSGQTSRVLDYFIERAAMVLDILDETQVVTKNAEFARVFGVEFFSVLSRGSQFKVESFMFRIAKPESLMLLSPSREDVGRQNAAECIPLIMEPKSAYYKSPLVVLDFQSLYPSIMIAYNYCYTTCLGRVGTFKGKNKFGVLDDLKLPDGLLGKLKDHIQIAPNGIMYVTTTVRKSLLSKMLTELLDTRVMVKQAMKTSKDDKALLRVLDARQLSLKFICNVTYGYTSASFSGRMPGVEVADSIVQSGRETLEKAITTINTNPRWGAKVVYGDTDSLFVSLEGKTKEQAFRLGNEMADAITAMNPKPVKLKFEKVYFPCLLMAKKRYVGFKYEHPDDKEPVFDAKGIETVRRDGIPAGQKMVEKCLKILFRSQDLSEAKAYCQSSWQKLMDGRVSLGDFVFAKEVKLGKYSDKGPPPPGVVVAARRVTRDPRAEAQYGDRVPYVIVRGEPKSRLVDRAFEPLEVLKDRHQYQLDAHYYIEHQLIPPLERVFNLVGANVASWYAEMPKVARPLMPESLAPDRSIADAKAGPSKPKFTIDEHFKSASCIVCGKASTQVLCPACTARPQETTFALEIMQRGVQQRAANAQQICASCCGVPSGEDIECESVDCPWLFERYKAGRELRAMSGTLTEIARVGILTIPSAAVFSPSNAPPLSPLPARFPPHSPRLRHLLVVGGRSSHSTMSSSTYPRNPPIQVTAPTTDWAPNGRALSPPPAAPRSPARLNFTAATTSSNNGSKGASWLFNQLNSVNTRPKISNGIEHQVQQQNGGLKPPVIDEADEREPGAEPSNASVLSFSSSIEVMSEGGLRRNGTVRSADHIHSRASDDGFVRVNKPPIPGSMRKSDTMPRPRTSDTVDRLKEASSSNIPLTSLYLVSGLPKNPATWTLADADSVVGVHHSEGAVGRWWRAEVLGSTITPGVGGGKDKKKKRANKSRAGETAETKAGLGKGDLGKMLSKSLKLSFPREVEIIASTLQPASTIHSFTFSVPTTRDLTAPASASQLRASVFSTTTAASGTIGDRNSYLGHPGMSHGMHLGIPGGSHIGLAPPELDVNSTDPNSPPKETMYHGVCLTVWSHADEERTAAIRRTLETAAYARSRTHKVSMSSMATSIAPSVATSTGRSANGTANRPRKRSMPWSGTEMDESETDAGAMTESEADFSGNADGAGASTLFLPQNTVFWLPYALTLVSRHPIYDLMRDYLTLSWARFSKDVQSHTLQIAKILEAPSPRAGDIVRLDAGASGEHLEVVCRFPGGLDFGRGLVDVNFTMWPIFRCLNLDNILTLCEIALAPTGRVLFISRHPAMLGLAVSTLKYLCELRGWNGVAHHNVHSRDAKIYLEDPGPWIIAMSTESRYCVRPSPEVCVCDLDINYVNCPSPPPGAISVKLQREKFRKILMGAFDQYFHPDHGVPSEFKEAFPAGRFRPLCKITSKRGSSVVAESIKAPEWWHQTRVVTAFDTVLKEKAKKPSFIKRISTLGLMNKRPAQLSPAERLIQASIRKRATAFVDARDDLETKIGRLSRRLNFLMTESELWRQKFVAFEGYAEKLSAEAGELRSKINKEQRESKRLSGLVGIAAHEKHMLQQRLVDTESKHKQAVVELERMKVEMEEMEEEREKMVQDVEAQIERALASMTLSDHYESDSQSSNFSMRSTGRIGAGRSRPGSANSHRPGTRGLRSFATSSTLAVNAMADEDMERIGEGQDDTMVIEEEEGSGEGATARKASSADLKQKKRRFSASSQEPHLDGLNAVDVGISQRIDTVAEKMMAIQAKLENAFEQSRKTRSRAATPRSQMDSGDEEYMGSRPSSRNRPGRFYRSETPPQRSRTFSTQSQGERDAIIARRTASSSGLRNVAVPPVPPLPSQSGLAPQPTLQRMPSGVSLSATRPMTPPEERPRPQQNNSSGSSRPTGYPVRGGTPAVTDDSGDDSYMSAYSYSPPRTEQALHGDDDDEPLDVLDVRHEASNTSVAEALLEDHDITREFGKGRSPLLMARNRSLSNVTTSTARGSYEQQQAATPKSSAVAAVSVPVETASPTVSDYSTQSSTTTRLTSVADSTEC